jgi:RNA polymerase-associated protein CTR9
MDKSIRYNIAVIQQKAAEMLFSLAVPKRTLEELQQALEYASQAQSLLWILSEDTTSSVLPYDKEMAQQRRQYGVILLRKGADHLSQQEQYESEHKAKIDAAREVRMAEKAAVEAKEVHSAHFSR